MKNYTYRIINSNKFKNPLYYGHAPNLNSILNKLSVSKNCSKSKRSRNEIEAVLLLYMDRKESDYIAIIVFSELLKLHLIILFYTNIIIS